MDNNYLHDFQIAETKNRKRGIVHFRKMAKAKKLDTIPVSREYEEIIFDLPELWRGQSWNFVKFTLSDETN